MRDPSKPPAFTAFSTELTNPLGPLLISVCHDYQWYHYVTSQVGCPPQPPVSSHKFGSKALRISLEGTPHHRLQPPLHVNLSLLGDFFLLILLVLALVLENQFSVPASRSSRWLKGFLLAVLPALSHTPHFSHSDNPSHDPSLRYGLSIGLVPNPDLKVTFLTCPFLMPNGKIIYSLRVSQHHTCYHYSHWPDALYMCTCSLWAFFPPRHKFPKHNEADSLLCSLVMTSVMAHEFWGRK